LIRCTVLTPTPCSLAGLRMLTPAAPTRTRAIVAAEGLTSQTADGSSQSHPAARNTETARSQAVRLLADIGLTQKGRQSVDIVPLPSAKRPDGRIPAGLDR
jgi:hypothetical protein